MRQLKEAIAMPTPAAAITVRKVCSRQQAMVKRGQFTLKFLNGKGRAKPARSPSWVKAADYRYGQGQAGTAHKNRRVHDQQLSSGCQRHQGSRGLLDPAAASEHKGDSQRR